MKPANKKLLALLLAAMIPAGLLAGCGEEETTSSGSSAASTTGSSESTGSGETAEEDTELYEFTLLGNLKTELLEVDELYFEEIGKATNTNIIVELPPASSYTERLQMMIASGEYADVTLFPDHISKVYVDACREGVFIRLNELLEDCPNIMAHTYDISWETLQILRDEGDDSIYSVPRTSIARADGYTIRKDWLDAVGYTDYTEGDTMTIDQLKEILTLFTYNDPDGNGIDDTYGFGTYGDADGNLGVFFSQAFGLGGWGEYDGEIIDLARSRNHDNYKRALQFSQDLWNEGLVDPDAPTIKSDVALDRFKKGITGVRGEFAGWMTMYEDQMKELDPDAELIYVPSIVENEGDPYTAGAFSTGFWGEWAIANTAEKPERILAVFDYMLSDEGWPSTNYGPEGYSWTEENGVVTPTENYTQDFAGRNILRRNDDPGFFVSLDQSAENRERIENLIDICVNQYVFSLDQGYRPPIADDPTFIDYEKNMKVQISKIVVGELPVDEWDAILDGWYDAGGETYVEQMRTYIESTR